MSIDIVLKAGIGLLGASAISFGGYSLHDYLTATLENRYALLDEKSDKWDKLVQKYEEVKANEQTGTPQKMESFEFKNSEPKGSETKKQQLINHCKSIFKTSLRDNQENLGKREKEVKSWCIEEASALKP